MYAKTTVLAVLLQILFVQSLPQNFHRRAKTATFVDNPFLNPQINNNVANTQLPEQLPVKPTALNVQELVENPFFIEFFNQYQKQQTALATTTSTTFAPITRPTRPTTTAFDFDSLFASATSEAPFLSQQQHTNKNAFVLDTPLFISETDDTTSNTNNSPRRRLRPSKTSPIRRITPTTPAPVPVQSFQELNTKTNVEEPQRIEIPIQTFTQNRPEAKKPSPKIVTNRGDFKHEDETFRRQAANAMYMFSSDIDDNINGNLHQRAEVREGNTVKGKYAYSDGFFKRTVHYEADDKGFRVTKELVEPIGDGPQVNPDGHARVSSFVAGEKVNYEITRDDIRDTRQQSFKKVEEDYEE